MFGAINIPMKRELKVNTPQTMGSVCTGAINIPMKRELKDR
jgi:hypothetical protein